MMMQIMNGPTPEGGQMPMMAMVAKAVGSTSLAIGWIYPLFNSAVIGAIFAWLFNNRALSAGQGLACGALYGIAWWILGEQILMPLALGMPPVASIMMPPMRMVAVGSLVGHMMYGLILGGLFSGVRAKRQAGCSVGQLLIRLTTLPKCASPRG
jgi:hypothetical protein